MDNIVEKIREEVLKRCSTYKDSPDYLSCIVEEAAEEVRKLVDNSDVKFLAETVSDIIRQEGAHLLEGSEELLRELAVNVLTSFLIKLPSSE